MYKKLQNYLCKALIAMIALTALPLSAFASYDSDLRIEITDVDNRSFDPWADEEAEITFEISDSAYVTLDIFDEDGDLVDVLVYDEEFARGEHTVSWNGEDRYGTTVDQGDYEFRIEASAFGREDDSDFGYLIVKRMNGQSSVTDDPGLKNVFVTKENFDPDNNEITEIVFELTAKADLKIQIFDDRGREVEELYDKDDRLPGIYNIKWDGDDADEGTYTYEITARNSDGSDSEEGEIVVQEDRSSSNKPEISKDSVDQIPFEPGNKDLEINFFLAGSAEVTVEIRDDDQLIATILEDKHFNGGFNTVRWDAEDRWGYQIEDGIYQYKIIATNNAGKDTEKGNFLVDGSSGQQSDYANYSNGNSGSNNQNYYNPYNFYASCGGFYDVAATSPYCTAIDWAQKEGVVQGYYDGSFHPDQIVSRVEALKMITLAMNVETSNSNYYFLPFPDVSSNAWYMPYLNAGLQLGIVKGYDDGKFRPSQSVSRAEALKMVINTGVMIDGINPSQYYGNEVPFLDVSYNDWYYGYAWFARLRNLVQANSYLNPNQALTRAELIDILYRYQLMN